MSSAVVAHSPAGKHHQDQGLMTRSQLGNLPLNPALPPQADDNQNIQIAPFRDRLALRRQRYVPLGDRSSLQSLTPLFAGGKLEQVAAGQWGKPPVDPATQRSGSAESNQPKLNQTKLWILARLVELDHDAETIAQPSSAVATKLAAHPSISLTPYLYIDLTQAGDLCFRLLPIGRHLDAELALSTLDGIGREFRISAQASFIQRMAQLQEMQLELVQEFAIRRSLYNSLGQALIGASQALRYFDRLLDESPYPASSTPVSDRLIQRRQLIQAFSSHPQPSLWNAYAAVAYWVNHRAPGDAAHRWQSCCQGPGARMLRQALAYAVALQYDQKDNSAAQAAAQSFSSASSPSGLARPSIAQRSLAASGALQERIMQQRSGITNH